MSRVSNLGAFVFVTALLGGGLLAINEALTTTTPADGTQDQFDSVEQLLVSAGDFLPLAIMLLVALAVVAVISGRL
jgi:hypothetical protein